MGEREIAWFSSLMGLIHNKNWAENVNAVDFRSGERDLFLYLHAVLRDRDPQKNGRIFSLLCMCM